MPNETITSLNSLSAELSLLKHPFYQAWTAGTLTADRLRNYAVQYYRHVAAFPRYLSGLHSRCEDLETRQLLLENLVDEERGRDNHPELWLQFAEALGLTREKVLDAPPLPAADRLAIYRNAYQVRLIDALDDTYSILHALLGDETFFALGGAFVAPPVLSFDANSCFTNAEIASMSTL